MHRTFELMMVLSAGVLIVLSGCSTSSPRVVAPVGSAEPQRTVAVVGNEAVSTADLGPVLFELAGREALREYVLDRALEAELSARGLSVGSAALEAERRLMFDRAGDQQEEMLRERRLGPARREAMVRRNAALRLLSQGLVRVEPGEVDLAMEIAYGVKYRARLILAANERDAGVALGQLGARPSAADVARIAERWSIDPTARVGGVLPLVSPVDPAYPVAVRSALGAMKPGDVSAVLPLAAGAAVVYLESVEGASTPSENARAQMEAELRLGREREAMERLARQLVDRQRVDVLDRSLGWSWDGR